ncbi:Smr/MutS family protein [Chelatococcus sp. GCM10030263]|uniref:Smr/MutS family protein n=1 Tax=Chelatococcus sp. GCM10030263 TaxID=3273387 RepID=UPI00360F9712
MRRRRGRLLDPEEVALWRHVTRNVKPLSGRDEPADPPAAPAPVPEPEPVGTPPAKAVATRSTKAPAKPVAPKLAPLAPLDRRQRLKLRRGTEPVEASLDLHGMRQSEAHASLVGFLQRAQRADLRLVVIITGKGGARFEAGAGDLFAERGILRRVVPQWLAAADLRSVVLGYGEAGREHGGAGALYVRLRRRREARS